MAAFNKFNSFVTEVAAGTHAACLGADTDTLKVALTNTAPVATNTILGNITQIASGNGYTTGGEDATNAFTDATGTITVAGTDITWTAGPSAMAQFRYCVLYNDTPTSPVDPLIGWWDNGSAVDLANGESFTLNFGASLFTIT